MLNTSIVLNLNKLLKIVQDELVLANLKLAFLVAPSLNMIKVGQMLYETV